MTLVDDAPDCATCAHPAEHHASLTVSAPCFTNAVGEQVPRLRDVECTCTAYSPTAEPTELEDCSDCGGNGIAFVESDRDGYDREETCDTCDGVGKVEVRA